MSNFRTIVISIPADAPAEGLHQAVRDYAAGNGMTVRGNGAEWFLSRAQAPSMADLLAEPAPRKSRGPVPFMLAVDEMDLMERHQ